MIVWPRRSLAPRSFACNPHHRTIRASVSLAGREQVVASGAGVWSVRLEDIPIYTDGVDRRLIWEDLAVRIGGLLGKVEVPIYACRRLRWTAPLHDVPRVEGGVPHDDGAFFDDGTGYATVEHVDIDPVRRGSRTVRAKTSAIGPVHPPARFSIDARLYQVVDVVKVGDVTEMTVWPPIRDDSHDKADLNFTEPTLRCRLVDERAMDLTFDPGDYSRATVDFVEAF